MLPYFCFPLAVAVTTISFTVLSLGGFSNGRIVTGCWKANSIVIQKRDLANPNAPTASEIFSPVYDVTDCYEVESEWLFYQKEYLRTMSGSPIQVTTGDYTSDDFCCLELKAIASPNDPLYVDVPFINLGDGNKKYEIMGVKCRP